MASTRDRAVGLGGAIGLSILGLVAIGMVSSAAQKSARPQNGVTSTTVAVASRAEPGPAATVTNQPAAPATPTVPPVTAIRPPATAAAPPATATRPTEPPPPT